MAYPLTRYGIIPYCNNVSWKWGTGTIFFLSKIEFTSQRAQKALKKDSEKSIVPVPISGIFYFTFIGKTIILLHTFLKKTAKTPLSEIKKAEVNYSQVISNKEIYE